MAYVYTWNTATPLDTADVSDGARVFREDVKGALNERLLSVFVNLTADPLVHAKVIVAATGKVNLDGLAAGDTYIIETSANQVDFIVGGSDVLRLTSIQVLSRIPLSVDSGNKLFLDGGSDTYIWEPSANTLSFGAGGTESLRIVSTGIGIPATAKIFVDGVNQGGDTYIYESSANVLDFFVGGTLQHRMTTSLFSTVQDVSLTATKKLFVDGGGDTYFIEFSANRMLVVAGGSTALDINTTYVLFGGDVKVPATNKLYLDGGGDTFIQELSANNLLIQVGGNPAIVATATTLVFGHATTDSLGFFASAGNSQRTVTGSRATGAALTSLLSQLAAYSLIVDGSTA